MPQFPTLFEYFDSDSHTSADGAYSSALVSRKWVVLASLICLAHAHATIDYSALHAVTNGVVAIDRMVLGLVFVGGLLITGMQYIAVCVQLCLSYKIIFYERVIRRVNDEFQKLNNNISANESELRAARSDVVAFNRQLQEIRGSLVNERQAIAELESIDDDPEELRDRRVRIDNISIQLNNIMQNIENSERLVASREVQLELQKKQFDSAKRETPEAKKLFQWLEISKDVVRFTFPLVLLVVSGVSIISTMLTHP